MKQKVILVSHGNLSEGMKHSVEMIVGDQVFLQAYGLQPGHHCDDIVRSIEEQIQQDIESTYVLIGDLYGGSVCNSLTLLAHYHNVKIIAGMNMLLIISILLSSEELNDEKLAQIINESKSGMQQIKPVCESDGDVDDFF